jgi:hypothetical protein
MAETVSTAGHGPSSGYSGMNAHLDNYLNSHPAHADEQKSRRRSLGPRPGDYKTSQSQFQGKTAREWYLLYEAAQAKFDTLVEQVIRARSALVIEGNDLFS